MYLSKHLPSVTMKITNTEYCYVARTIQCISDIRRTVFNPTCLAFEHKGSTQKIFLKERI